MTSHTLTSPDKSIEIEWDCGYRNPASDSAYLRLAQVVEEPDTGVRIFYSLIITNTRNITFTYKNGAPPEHFAQFESFWEWCKKFIYIREGGVNIGLVDNPELLKASYPMFNRLVANPFQEEWGAAYNRAQVLFPADDVYKPDSLLKEDLLKNPDFLSAVAKLLETSALGVGK